MVAETILTPNDFIAPLFIDEGKIYKQKLLPCQIITVEVIDLTVKEVKELWSMGIKSVLLFIKCKR